MVVKIRHAKKGVSEYVAVMLLILITISGAIILYVYSSGLLGSLQGAQPQKPYANQITLEYYDWTGSSTCSTDIHKLCLTLRNVGSGIAVLADFFVGGTKTSPPTGSCTAYTVNGLGPQGATSTCQAILTVPITTVLSGVAYSVRVVTKDGSVFSYSCIAGQSTGSLS